MTIQITQTSIDNLIPYARNARTHSDAQVAQIAASITEFGWTNPILTDGNKGVIAGHGRANGSTQAGNGHRAGYRVKQFNRSAEKTYILADNQIALNAGWDEERRWCINSQML